MRSFAITLHLAALLCCGCAFPHRAAESSRTIQWYCHGRLACQETWRDSEGGGGLFLLTDPTVQTMLAIHTNQSALGGASLFNAGSFAIIVDSNTVPIIASGGTAIGNIIGATAKSALK